MLNMTPEEELRAVFDPILRPERRQHWYDNWSKWFVLTREVEDEKFPGRFKSKFQLKNHNLMSYLIPGIMIRLLICINVTEYDELNWMSGAGYHKDLK